MTEERRRRHRRYSTCSARIQGSNIASVNVPDFSEFGEIKQLEIKCYLELLGDEKQSLPVCIKVQMQGNHIGVIRMNGRSGESQPVTFYDQKIIKINKSISESLPIFTFPSFAGDQVIELLGINADTNCNVTGDLLIEFAVEH